MAEFVLNLGRVGDGAGDFFAKQLPIAVAQSLHLFAQRRFVGVQFRCQHGIRNRRLFTRQKDLQLRKVGGASRLIHLVPQPAQHLLQEGERPTPLEDLLRRTLQGDFRQPLLRGVVV